MTLHGSVILTRRPSQHSSWLGASVQTPTQPLSRISHKELSALKCIITQLYLSSTFFYSRHSWFVLHSKSHLETLHLLYCHTFSQRLDRLYRLQQLFFCRMLTVYKGPVPPCVLYPSHMCLERAVGGEEPSPMLPFSSCCMLDNVVPRNSPVMTKRSNAACSSFVLLLLLFSW